MKAEQPRRGIVWLDLRDGPTAYWADDGGNFIEGMPDRLSEQDARCWGLARSDTVYVQSNDVNGYYAIGSVPFPDDWRSS